MILTGNKIREELKNKKIIIEPFSEDQINPNSYNYRLGTEYIEIDNDKVYDLKNIEQKYEVKKIPEEGLLLDTQKIYLCNTKEIIGSTEYITSLIGKSSMGRLGLFLQVAADLGHQGQIHKWTLELRASIPTKIYPNMRIGQVTFWKTCGDKLLQDGYYEKFNGPHISRGVE